MRALSGRFAASYRDLPDPASAQRAVEVNGLRGDRVPGERLDGALAPRTPDPRREVGVGGEPVHAVGEAALEPGRVLRVVGHDDPGLPVHDDLGDTAHTAGDDRGLA